MISHTVGDLHLVLIASAHFIGIVKRTYALRFYNRLSTPARKSVSASRASCVGPYVRVQIAHSCIVHTAATWCRYVHSRKFSGNSSLRSAVYVGMHVQDSSSNPARQRQYCGCGHETPPPVWQTPIGLVQASCGNGLQPTQLHGAHTVLCKLQTSNGRRDVVSICLNFCR